jgi:hypothetical protein
VLGIGGVRIGPVTVTELPLATPPPLQHVYNEFTYLSRFLPSLFIAEHRDERPPALPW